jgi:uncharacterized protein YbjQ (UPF0145 family)
MADEPVEDPAQEREDQESLARIEAGGIPIAAERRLRELRGTQGEDGGRGVSFTSDLSVSGFALCHQLGLTPLSQVMGSSIYQMGYQSAWGQMQGGYGGGAMIELDTLSQALNEVRERALHRLAEEARQIGADAVVGVETRAGESELGGGGGQLALEHMVLGTAVRRKDARSEAAVRAERIHAGALQRARADDGPDQPPGRRARRLRRRRRADRPHDPAAHAQQRHGRRLRRKRAARDDGHVQRGRHRDPPARRCRDPSPQTSRRPIRLTRSRRS